MAAFVNSIMASTLDMDDGSMGLRGHLRVHRGHHGGIIIPSAMAVAQRQQATGKKLLEAVIAGYEVSLMTAWVIGQTVLAGLTGCYGAAAAAAKLLNLPSEKITQTFNIVSAHGPHPSYTFLWTKIDMSKESMAWSALTAIMAAFLSDSGFRATPGFYEYPENDKEPFESLGKDWEILGSHTLQLMVY
jgi:2-methylcitrate dehydratase PrpD